MEGVDAEAVSTGNYFSGFTPRHAQKSRDSVFPANYGYTILGLVVVVVNGILSDIVI